MSYNNLLKDNPSSIIKLANVMFVIKLKTNFKL